MDLPGFRRKFFNYGPPCYRTNFKKYDIERIEHTMWEVSTKVLYVNQQRRFLFNIYSISETLSAVMKLDR